jgi:hypothetical protein
MNEQLIKFIEICLMDGIITDKEREVILRKSIELGIPVDECEIIIEGMIIKSSKVSSNSNEKPEVELYINEEIININKLDNRETSDDELRIIFESNFKSKFEEFEQKTNNLEIKVNNISNEKKTIEDEISKNEIEYLKYCNEKINIENEKETQKETICVWFTNQIEKLISDNISYNSGKENFRLTSNEIILKKASKNIFGKKVPGEEIKLSFEDFFTKGEFQSSYFLLENDIQLIQKIEKIYTELIQKRNVLKENFKNSILNSKEILIKNDTDLNLLKNKLKSLNKSHEDTISKLNEVSISFLEVKNYISDKNFYFFKELYTKSPILFQSNIFSKYLEIIEVKNDKEIMNLTRFVNFIIKEEKVYSRQISNLFNKLDKGNLMENELNTLKIKKQNLISFYNSFHIMYQSLNFGKMGLYMRVYLELESIGIFNTLFEKTVMENLNSMNKHLQKLNNTLVEVGKSISTTNDYLSLLNNNMYELKLSVDETNYNLHDISESIQEGNGLLRQGNDLMDGLNSKVGLNNLLTGIQTYQLYKINKNTKGLLR